MVNCGWGLRGQIKERGGVDAGPSATTSDAEMARNPRPPGGLRRDGGHLFVAPPRPGGRLDSSARPHLPAVPAPTNDPLFPWKETIQVVPWCSPKAPPLARGPRGP